MYQELPWGFIDLLAFSAHIPASGSSREPLALSSMMSIGEYYETLLRIRAKSKGSCCVPRAASEITQNHRPRLTSPIPNEASGSLLRSCPFGPGIETSVWRIRGAES